MSEKIEQKYADAWNEFMPDENRLHESYGGKELLLPELDIVGWLRFKKALPNALQPSRHKNWFEILYMEHGQVDWWIEDTSYNFSAGNVLIISPNELHGAACGVMQPCEHYWLRFRVPDNKLIPGLAKPQQLLLLDFYRNLPGRMFQISSAVKHGFQRLISAHHNPTEFSEVTARCALLSILCTIASESQQSTPAKTASPLSPKIQNVLRMLQNRLDNPPSVKEMAKMAHMSEGTFRALFEKETGIPPNNYINIQRIREAKEMLKEGCSVTETAHALGYSSSQYFATVFKKWAGLSPSNYLNQITSGNIR